MPIYEYICPKCNSEFELRLSFDQSDSTAHCPNCEAAALRVISSFACKTGGNIQASEKPFRKPVAEEPAKSARKIAKVTPKGTRQTTQEKRKKKSS